MKINKIVLLNYLDELFPNATCELNYHNLFELLIAVMLSAQTTDISVNKVTPSLFNKYPNCESLGKAKQSDIVRIIKSIGLYKNKAKNIIETSKILASKYNCIVPNNIEELMTLPGVGRKTASVVLVEGYKLPAFPVDTHVERVSKRLGIAKDSESVLKVENKLKRLIPKDNWGKAHHQLIHFGRYFCMARKPNCEICKLKDYCRYLKK